MEAMSDDMFDMLMEGAHFEEKRESYVKAPFAWAGGKGRSLEHILPYLPKRERFVDVCGGSGTVLLARPRSKMEVFNDAYSGITDFYMCLKDKVKLEELIAYLDMVIHSREMFINYKTSWKNTADPVERAAKWYYMIVNSFGNLGRNFGRGTKEVSSFASKLPNSLQNFWPVHYRIQGVTIENLSFEQCIKDYDHVNTVFYIDPPYLHSDPGLYDEAWPLEKHKRLLQYIFDAEGFVALSGYDNELYNSFPWTNKITWETNITIGAKAHTETNNLKDKIGMMSKKATECLWIKEVGEC
jgi:DNA adenine methylase